MPVTFGANLVLQRNGQNVNSREAGQRARDGLNSLLQLHTGTPDYQMLVGLHTVKTEGGVKEIRLFTGDHFRRYLQGEADKLSQEPARPLELTRIFGKRMLKTLDFCK